MNSNSKHITDIREEYALSSLNEIDVNSNPILQFQTWFQEAITAEVDDVNAMTLSTVDNFSKPHSRIVLLKGVEENSFIFFTNYQSHKSKEIAINSAVSLVFHWKELQRQIRIEGIAKKISDEASANYFSSRPKQSQLGAWASMQSDVLESREELENRFNELQQKYVNNEVPKPPHWGGYAIEPSLLEFWQGRKSRLHDRLCFTLNKTKGWDMKRLNP